MLKILKQIFYLLDNKQKKKLLLLQILIVIMSIAEISGVFVVGFFISIVSDIENALNSNNFLLKIQEYFEFNSSVEFLMILSAIVLFIFFISSFISIFTTWKLAMYGSKIGLDISVRLYSHYLYKPWIFHASNNSNQLVNKIAQECQRVTSGIISHAMHMNAKIILVILMFVAILIYSPIVSIVGISFFTLAYWVLYKFLKKKISKNGEALSYEQEKRFRLMGEGFGGVKDLLLSKRQNFFINLFKKSSDKYAHHFGNNQVLSLVPKYALEFFAFSSVILLIIYFLRVSGDSFKTNEFLPMLAIYGFTGFKMLPSFQQIYYSISAIRGNISAFENISDDLSESLSLDFVLDQKKDFAEIKKKENFKSNFVISLQNVSFLYPNMTTPSVSNLNINIKKNKTIGIVGPTGSGKSTIIDILLGLIKPSSGKIFFDDNELTESNLAKWQSKCAFVAQNIFLADGSIKENIAFGMPNEFIDNDKILYASKISQVDEFLNNLPFRLDTKVGERGIQLSGGQRQRIGIARALYNDAEVLVFDEATSSLDLITEKLIMNAIYNFSGIKTIIIIAHRLATVKKCDYIYLIQNGTVVDEGTYEILLKNNKLFQGISGIT